MASEGLKFGMQNAQVCVIFFKGILKNKPKLEKTECELNVNERTLRHLQGSTAPSLKTADGVQPFHFWMGKEGPSGGKVHT